MIICQQEADSRNVQCLRAIGTPEKIKRAEENTLHTMANVEHHMVCGVQVHCNQCNFQCMYGREPPSAKSIHHWFTQFKETRKITYYRRVC
jgi:hypothetical protein